MPTQFWIVVLLAMSLAACVAPSAKDSGAANNGGPIVVLPNEKLLVGAGLKNGQMLAFRKISEPNETEGTVSLHFVELREGGLTFSVKNSFDKPIRYDIQITDLAGQQHYARSCPVMPGSTVSERWDDQAKEISIANIHFLDENDALTCEK